MSDHPTFPNPTIAEALCEIHFSLPDDMQWDPGTYGQLFVRIQDEFPLIEPVAGAPIRMRYRHHERPLLLQLSENILTINQVQDYAGWAQMQTDVLSGWSWLREIVGPALITRIGLRYINIIQTVADGEQMIDWLAPNQYVAKAVLESAPASNICEVQINSDTRAVVRVGEVARLENTAERGFVLDIDAVNHIVDGQQPDLRSKIDALHTIVWDIFDGFRTARLDKFLTREAQ